MEIAKDIRDLASVAFVTATALAPGVISAYCALRKAE
jgi:hypothetical protein